METTINYCEDGMAYISSDERRWHNRMNALAERHPDEVVIVKQPGENHGFIYGKFPQKWLKVSPPRQVTMTEEKREILRKSLQSIRGNSRKER